MLVLLTKNHKTVTFKRGDDTLTFLVSAVPRSYFRQMRQCGAFSDPVAPEVPAVRKPGTDLYVMVNGVVQYKTDNNHPTYVAALAQRGTRVIGLKLWKALSEDTNVVWDAVQPASDASPEAWQAYADALYLESCDFADGEVDAILTASEACDLVAAETETEKVAIKDF